MPLSVDIDVAAALRGLNESVDVSGDNISADKISRVRIDRFRQNVEYMPAKYDLLNALDVSRMADFVVLVLSAQIEVEEQGELLLRSIEGQGISNVIAVVQVCGLSTELFFFLAYLHLLTLLFLNRASIKSTHPRNGRRL